ncbi:unnamed protein product, partial [Rotaria sp. Silwood2]
SWGFDRSNSFYISIYLVSLFQLLNEHEILFLFLDPCNIDRSNSYDIDRSAYPRLGVDEQKIIGDLISNQFSLATITYNQQLTSSKFIKEWTDLENIIEKRDDY